MTKQNYGGQAVIEGVMMRGRQRATVAVRRADGSIVTFHESLDGSKRSTLESLPILRGVLLLWDTLNLGVRALNVSAAADLPDDEQPSTGETVGGVAFSLALGFGLFFALPLLLANALQYVGLSNLWIIVVENIFQLVIFIGYMILIGRIPDIQRVYGYHGAEHKAITATCINRLVRYPPRPQGGSNADLGSEWEGRCNSLSILGTKEFTNLLRKMAIRCGWPLGSDGLPDRVVQTVEFRTRSGRRCRPVPSTGYCPLLG